ncbi:MAG TPA: universal stress protein [Actinomycetota bacterium]|nr:universal stress protein [Actinomycetota bacterium]
MNKILVGTDTTAAADLAVEAAADLARRAGAELLVVQVRSNGARDAADPKKAADPDGYLRRMGERYAGVPVRSWAEDGEPAERLVEIAERERVDTIVLGNRGTHGSWWRVRDSVPNLVLRHAPCSVFIVDTRKVQ